VFRGMGKDDGEQHRFTCEEIYSINRVIDEVAKIVKLETMFMDWALMWYMTYKAIALVGHLRSLSDIKQYLL
jgi:hypothetical protein